MAKRNEPDLKKTLDLQTDKLLKFFIVNKIDHITAYTIMSTCMASIMSRLNIPEETKLILIDTSSEMIKSMITDMREFREKARQS